MTAGQMRAPIVAAFCALLVLTAGCATSLLNQAHQAEQLAEYDLAIARYSRVLRDDPDNVAARQGLERARLRAADEHYLSGRRLASQGRYEDALLELQVAAELNPANGDVARELQEVRVVLRQQLNAETGGRTELQNLLARTQDLAPEGPALPAVTLDADVRTGGQATTRAVYQMLAELTGLSVTFDPQVQDVPVRLSLSRGLPLTAALEAIGRATGTFFMVTSPGSILVAPDNPIVRREYVDDVVRQFTIQNADLKETMDALRIVADVRYVAPVTGTNTILVRDTPDRMRVIGRFIQPSTRRRPKWWSTSRCSKSIARSCSSTACRSPHPVRTASRDRPT